MAEPVGARPSPYRGANDAVDPPFQHEIFGGIAQGSRPMSASIYDSQATHWFSNWVLAMWGRKAF